MNTRRLSTKEAAETVGVSPNTLKSWLKDLPIAPERDGAGNFRFDDRAIDVLTAVKNLRGDGRSYETIRRVISPADQLEVTQEPPMDDRQHTQTSPEGETNSPGDHPPITQASPLDETRITRVITEAVATAIATQNDMAEKYGRAAHQIGLLEERVAQLTAQLGETRALLSSGVEEYQVERERFQVEVAEARALILIRERELADAHQRLIQMETSPSAPTRPWWCWWGW